MREGARQFGYNDGPLLQPEQKAEANPKNPANAFDYREGDPKIEIFENSENDDSFEGMGHVSWDEERNAKKLERVREHERAEQLMEIEAAVERGDYKLMEVPAEVWGFKRLGRDLLFRKKQFERKLAQFIQKRREQGKKALKFFDRIASVESQGDLVIDPELAAGIVEHEEVDTDLEEVLLGAKSGSMETVVNGKTYSYTKDDLVGSGGFGAAFVAYPVITAEGTQFIYNDAGDISSEVGIEQEDLHPPIVKVILHERRDDAQVASDVIRESAALDHKGALVGVKEYSHKYLGKDDEDNDTELVEKASVIVMERAEGKDLQSLLDSGREKMANLEGRTILAKAMLAVCKDLARLHSEGVAHRDIKPANLMVPLDRPEHSKIIDYGLVKRVTKKGEVPEEVEGDGMEITGTISYMTSAGIGGKLAAMRDMDVAAVGKSFGQLFDGSRFLDIDNTLALFPRISAITRGELYRAPDFRDEDEREKYLSSLRYDQERDLACLIDDTVLANYTGDERERKRIDLEIPDIHEVVERLEIIVHEIEVVARARRAIDSSLEGATGDAISGVQFAELVESMGSSPNIGRLEGILEGIGSFHKSKVTPRAERIKMLDTMYDQITSGQDGLSRILREEAIPELAGIPAQLEGAVEDMRLALRNGDADKAHMLYKAVVIKRELVPDFIEYQDKLAEGSSLANGINRESADRLLDEMLQNIESFDVDKMEDNNDRIVMNMDSVLRHARWAREDEGARINSGDYPTVGL